MSAIQNWDKVIYLAGKVGGPKWEIALPIKHQWVASDGNNHFGEHDWTCEGPARMGDKKIRELVAEHAVSQIKECDGLVAYLDTPDSFGSIAEIAFASAIGKKVLVLVRIPKGMEKTHECGCSGHGCAECENWGEMHDAYWFVCALPRVIVFEVTSDDEARARISSTFPPRTYSDYQEYLLSDAWQSKRERVLLRHGNKCALCNCTSGLHVHHKTYDRIGDERDDDLIPLCRRCHARHHGKAVVD